MDKSLPVLLALVFIVSGCAMFESDTDTTEQTVNCNSMHFTVMDANGSQAEVTNLGHASFGNVTVTWEYYNAPTIVQEYEAPGGGETVFFETDEESRLQTLDIQHQECASRTASYSD